MKKELHAIDFTISAPRKDHMKNKKINKEKHTAELNKTSTYTCKIKTPFFTRIPIAIPRKWNLFLSKFHRKEQQLSKPYNQI